MKLQYKILIILAILFVFFPTLVFGEDVIDQDKNNVQGEQIDEVDNFIKKQEKKDDKIDNDTNPIEEILQKEQDVDEKDTESKEALEDLGVENIKSEDIEDEQENEKTLYEKGQQELDIYKALDLFIQGLNKYPKNPRYIEGIIRSLKIILSNSKDYHIREDFSEAIKGYEIIIGTNEAPKDIKWKAEKNLYLAEEGIKLKSDNILYKTAQNESDPFKALDILLKGQDLYKDNPRYKEGIIRSLKTILSSSKFRHNNGEFKEAIHGYNTIIGTEETPYNLLEETKKLLKMAQDGKVYIYGPLIGKTIMLDPGHGGRDPGAVNKALNIKEKDLNNSLTRKIADMLMAEGANVIYTRIPENDVYVSLQDRADIANKSNADLFLSIHHDSSTNKSNSGISTHYSTYKAGINSSEAYVKYNGKKYPFVREIPYWKGTSSGIVFLDSGKEVTKNVNDVIVYDDKNPSGPGADSKKLSDCIFDAVYSLGFSKTSYKKDRNLYVTRSTNMPAALLEAGYISNEKEALRVSNPKFVLEIAKKVVAGIIKYFIT